MPRFCSLLYLVLASGHCAAASQAETDGLVREALAAEGRLDTRRSLELFLAADKSRPNDPFLLQKIARQYSDAIVDLENPDDKKASAQHALDYSLRAFALAPNDPVNVLSLAVCHGTLGLYSDTRTKVDFSRLVKKEAEQALALDPSYAWAHHLLGRWHHEVVELGSTSRFFVSVFYGGLPTASASEAVRHLKRAVELEPDELEHHLELGFAYISSGQITAARGCFEKGLAMPSQAKHDESAKTRAREALAKLGISPLSQ